jgi:hypothetical protein
MLKQSARLVLAWGVLGTGAMTSVAADYRFDSKKCVTQGHSAMACQRWQEKCSSSAGAAPGSICRLYQTDPALFVDSDILKPVEAAAQNTPQPQPKAE